MKKKNLTKGTKLKNIFRTVGAWLGTNTFWYVILGCFIAQAIWIAWSGAFSMAYDEFFHLAVIKEYAQGLTPFIDQPPGPAEFGALARDPSFLYYYILSFPYRIIASVWHTLTPQMIALRFINIGLFAGGLLLYRKLLLRVGLSRRKTNIILLFFMLVPTVVMVAAQLNYDNMMFLASGAALLLAANIILAIQKKQAISPIQIIALLTILMAGSIVKYAFLPLAVPIGGVVAAQIFLAFRRKQLAWGAVRADFATTLKKKWSWALLLGLVFVGVLFVQRIGGNVVMYGTPAPDCDAVLTLDACRAHAAFGRNEGYKDKNYQKSVTTQTKLTYPIRWYNKMIRESFFVVGPREIGYQTGKPLPTAYLAGKIIMPIMIIVVLGSFLWLWRRSPIWQLFLITTIFYTSVLFLTNFSEYVETGVPVAIHGRYIIYVMPLVAALTVVAVGRYIRGRKRQIAYAITAILLSMMLLGGGWLPYVIRTADNWFWPHAVPASRALRSMLWYVIPK